MDVVRWAEGNVASTLCSCLATHALLKHRHGIDRQPLPSKRWGVYSHRVCQPGHPLLRGINTRFDVPHSRYNDITRQQLEEAGLTVLVESAEGGVHMAVSADQFRTVFFQGHPEYNLSSLLKEFKRELQRYLAGELPEPPPFPEHYFSEHAAAVARRHLERIGGGADADEELLTRLEQELKPLIDNTWGDTAKAVIANWLGLVYQLTNLDRTKLFMEGVDPDDPLAMVK
jgi:homoserine O-succinyltransferase